MRSGCRKLAFVLLWLQASLLGRVVVGQGNVEWAFGVFGVNEDDGFVELCADYSEAVNGFSVETSTTDFAAVNGTDYLSVIGPNTLLVWEADSTRACIDIIILNDDVTENDEIFYVNMVRVVNSPNSSIPTLQQTIVMIMDDDRVPVRFDEDVISVTDDVGSVEVCLGVVDELVDDDFYFKIPILIQTVNGTAEPGYDYADFNNMTVGAQSHAILSITSHRHCFRISIPARPDDGLDDRNFFVAVELRVRKGMDMYTMGADVSLPNPLEIIIQPSAQIEFGDILDTVLTNPLFTVSMDDSDDTNLCYQVNGDSGDSYNLVSDTCFSINARYEAIEGVDHLNKIDQLFITASDAARECSSILIEASRDCSLAYVFRGNQVEIVPGRYRRNGVEINVNQGFIEILLPCDKYPGGGIKVVAKCNSEFLEPNTRIIYPDKNLYVDFYRGKLPMTTQYPPHGLVGQFWHRSFTMEQVTGVLPNGKIYDNAFMVTPPVDLDQGNFIGFKHLITWDKRFELCLYAGSFQAGTTSYSPNDSVIEGVYADYKVDQFGTDFTFAVFSQNALSCPNVEQQGN